MKNDSKIKKLLTIIGEKRKTVSTKPVIAWRTNLVWSKNNNNTEYFENTCNLNTIRNPVVFVKLYASMLKDTEMYSKASLELEVPVNTNDFKWNSFTLEEWKEDFKNKIKMLKWEKDNKDLVSAENKLKALRSDDAKTEDALSDIESLLSEGVL